MKTQVIRYHDISCGHRVAGHESKCQHLHGHNYRIHFTCEADELDQIGRVVDFGVVKARLCMWIEDNWDHKFLAWEHDPIMTRIKDLVTIWDQPIRSETNGPAAKTLNESLVWLPFNPTAENMAQYLLSVVGPVQLEGTGVRLTAVRIEETAKCHVEVQK